MNQLDRVKLKVTLTKLRTHKQLVSFIKVLKNILFNVSFVLKKTTDP